MHPDLDSWSSEERRALEAWVPALPPPGFAERATRAAEATRARSARRRRRSLAAAAAAAALIALGGMELRRRSGGEASEGSLADLAERTSVRLGSRGVLVAEVGSAARWTIDGEGRARVHHTAGNIFYRVDPGGPFIVETPAGTVRVTGTCFRIEVVSMKAFPAAFLGGAAGAALAGTLVTVSVSEGAVVAEAAKGPSVVRAGETVTLRSAPDGGAVATGAPPSAARRAPEASEERAELLATLPVEVRRQIEGVLAERDALVERRSQLESELRDTQEKLAAAERDLKEDAIVDIDQGTLNRMAEECELRFDHLALTAEPPNMSPAKMDRLEITPEEKAVADEVFAQHHEELVATIRALYTEVTGDRDTGSLAPNAMASEMNDKVPTLEIQQAFQRLALERAGQLPPPANPGAESPIYRLYRAFMTSGDRLEAAISDRMGPDFAHRYRRLEDGWGSKRRGSYGCPGEHP
ncbi:MAG: hypothetical protein AAFU79_05885 [Myxococcota bacterium]